MKDFYDVFINELKRAYSAELQLVRALPKMAKAATSPKLKEAFRHHLKETQEQVERLQAISIALDAPLEGAKCPTMKSLIKEGLSIGKTTYDSNAKDSALIIAAQRIEHYEIATYGSLKAFAKHLKIDFVIELIEANEKQEAAADSKLTSIAEGGIFSSGVNTDAFKKCA